MNKQIGKSRKIEKIKVRQKWMTFREIGEIKNALYSFRVNVKLTLLKARADFF